MEPVLSEKLGHSMVATKVLSGIHVYCFRHSQLKLLIIQILLILAQSDNAQSSSRLSTTIFCIIITFPIIYLTMNVIYCQTFFHQDILIVSYIINHSFQLMLSVFCKLLPVKLICVFCMASFLMADRFISFISSGCCTFFAFPYLSQQTDKNFTVLV